jgi:hypothetical protein
LGIPSLRYRCEIGGRSNLNGHSQRLTLAPKLYDCLLSRRSHVDVCRQLTGIADRRVIESQNDVTGLDTGVRRGAGWFDLRHQSSCWRLEPE